MIVTKTYTLLLKVKGVKTMAEYKVRTVSGEKKFQLLLNDMANQGYRLVSFSYVGGVFNIMAVFER